MSSIYCFGEVLWDVFPGESFLGGAPLNVAYHLARLGRFPRLVSSVGRDSLGDLALSRAAESGVNIDYVSRESGLPTGTVNVRIDASGQASYEFAAPAAWDQIEARAVPSLKGSALVFGSLALRSEGNRAALRALLDSGPSLRVCDLNLRKPHDDWRGIRNFVEGADLLKLNEDEARQLAGDSLKTAPAAEQAPYISAALGCRLVCITLGERGAILWDGRTLHAAPARVIEVQDTVGAGDAFTAAVLDSLMQGSAAPDWPTILRRACALGAWVASRPGAQPDYRREDVLGFIE